MYALLAMAATVLTSLLPILNKRILRDTRPAVVAWAINACSLPILALGTFLLTQCQITPLLAVLPLVCTTHLPQIDRIFLIALLASVVLNWGATLLSTSALAQADASLVSPLLTFNPAFTLLVAWGALGETPGLQQAIGVAVLLFGAYLLDVEEARTGLLTPLRVMLQQPGTVLALLASALWGTTTALEKLAIEHMRPQSGPFVAFVGTILMVVLLTPQALFPSKKTSTPEHKRGVSGLRVHPRALFLAGLIAGIAPLFGFTAIALGLVGYVTALFKLSAVFTIVWAWLFLGEGNIHQRMLGTLVMLVGGALIAV
ncbi:MAG TPA: EamA family transporter [Ktedonobacteraceae bacterium]|nr:EamA family transporter [Ktedonobacteraceae bacterium]